MKYLFRWEDPNKNIRSFETDNLNELESEMKNQIETMRQWLLDIAGGHGG